MVQDENTPKLIVVMAVKLCKYARNHWIKWENCMVHKWYLNRSVIIKKKSLKKKNEQSFSKGEQKDALHPLSMCRGPGEGAWLGLWAPSGLVWFRFSLGGRCFCSVLRGAKRWRPCHLGNGPTNSIRTLLISTLKLLLKFVPGYLCIVNNYLSIQMNTFDLLNILSVLWVGFLYVF